MTKKKLLEGIELPKAQESNIETLFQGKTQETIQPRERRTKHKDVSMTPTTFREATALAKSAGCSLNDFINLLLENEIRRNK